MGRLEGLLTNKEYNLDNRSEVTGWELLELDLELEMALVKRESGSESESWSLADVEDDWCELDLDILQSGR